MVHTLTTLLPLLISVITGSLSLYLLVIFGVIRAIAFVGHIWYTYWFFLNWFDDRRTKHPFHRVISDRLIRLHQFVWVTYRSSATEVCFRRRNHIRSITGVIRLSRPRLLRFFEAFFGWFQSIICHNHTRSLAFIIGTYVRTVRGIAHGRYRLALWLCLLFSLSVPKRWHPLLYLLAFIDFELWSEQLPLVLANYLFLTTVNYFVIWVSGRVILFSFKPDGGHVMHGLFRRCMRLDCLGVIWGLAALQKLTCTRGTRHHSITVAAVFDLHL